MPIKSYLDGQPRQAAFESMMRKINQPAPCGCAPVDSETLYEAAAAVLVDLGGPVPVDVVSDHCEHIGSRIRDAEAMRMSPGLRIQEAIEAVAEVLSAQDQAARMSQLAAKEPGL